MNCIFFEDAFVKIYHHENMIIFRFECDTISFQNSAPFFDILEKIYVDYRDYNHFLFDMQKVYGVDSSAMGIFIHAITRNKLHQATVNKKFVIYNVNQQFKRLLRITKVSVLPSIIVVEDEEAAFSAIKNVTT